MRFKTFFGSAMLGTMLLSYGIASAKSEPIVYEQNWSSLSKHKMPQWLLDAKFGIYSHWGPQTVVREMPKGTKMSSLEAFELWKGEKFNAKEWAKLYKDAGAQFAGYLANHGSGCLNWDSQISDWNIMNHGPKRDILGEVLKAVKSEGMHTMASFHSVTANSIWGQVSKSNRTYIQPDVTKKDEFSGNRVGNSDWMDGWCDRIQEAVEKYDIEMLWFDVSFGNTVGADMRGILKEGKYDANGYDDARGRLGGWKESAQQKLIANYYNWAEENNHDVDVVYKSKDLPNNIGMRDIENGSLAGLQYDPWMADIDMTHHTVYPYPWFYHKDELIKDANVLVDMLIDITSKNGRMLLNVPPKSDGTFAPHITKELKAMGAWLKDNGEGIYGSTPWCIYGEGPSDVFSPGHHGQGKVADVETFTSEDIRYTVNGDYLYAFVLDMPKDGKVEMKTLGSSNKLYPNEVVDITLMGSKAKVEWSHTPEALVITMPKGVDSDSFAYGFRIKRSK